MNRHTTGKRGNVFPMVISLEFRMAHAAWGIISVTGWKSKKIDNFALD